MTYTAWWKGNPNNLGYDPARPDSGEWCVETYVMTDAEASIDRDMDWNDVDCENHDPDIIGGICETGPL
jgi:hypothetical protein